MVSSAGFAPLLGRLARHRPALADAKDRFDREAFAIAMPACRDAMAAAIFFLGRYKIFKGAFEHQSATSVVVRALDLYASELYGRVFDASNADGSSGLDEAEFVDALRRLGLETDRDAASAQYARWRGATDAELTRDAFKARRAPRRRSPSCSSS